MYVTIHGCIAVVCSCRRNSDILVHDMGIVICEGLVARSTRLRDRVTATLMHHGALNFIETGFLQSRCALNRTSL